MIFQDNIIKQYLKNVYFIAGTPCGGKTTVSRALAKKYGIPVYDIDEYCNRPDHQGFSDFIHSATDFEAAKATCNETLLSLNAKYYEDVKASGYFYVDRADGLSVDETVARTAKQFGFERLTQIVRVEKDTPFAEEFLQFVENCSWTEVRDHIVGLIRNWEFTDWEKMFAAVKDGKIIGMTSLLKTDYYPLPEIFPWVSCVFVEKEFRGDRISGKLIDAANRYAKEQGFTKTYIPTEYTGLYERYGYTYVKDIVNYGGGTDRLYVKEL